MKILKFGGTSLGNVENIKKVSEIIEKVKGKKIVVLSAMSGTTNALHQISEQIALCQYQNAQKMCEELFKKYKQVVSDLYQNESIKKKANAFVKERFKLLKSYIHSDSLQDTIRVEKIIVAQGEILSTHLCSGYMQEMKIQNILLSAFDFMRIAADNKPDIPYITKKLSDKMTHSENLYITQGYICLNHKKEIDNLKRGGSDYTASLIAAGMDAEEIQIWTDISGMHNNDPRYVKNTFPLKEISFEEAAELAYFGAKILHPQSVIPAKNKNIPVLLKNTFDPKHEGTIIKNCKIPLKVRAIAAKDNITAIKIKSFRMLMAYGFLNKIFKIFEKYKTAIDTITTSEVAVSLTVDDTTFLQPIIKELEKIGEIQVDKNLSIICLAGNFKKHQKQMSASIFNALGEMPLRMISYGGSNYNISLVLDTTYKIAALQILNKTIFEK